MEKYLIITDSSCDISPDLLREWGVESVNLTFRFDGDENDHTDRDMNAADFYQKMRDGGVSRTSAANTEDFRTVFEPLLKEGFDILYIGFSSGLSSTVNAGRMAGEELAKEYPDRRIVVIDTLCASAGEGMTVYFAVQKKAEGASMDETADYVRGILPHLCHWFTVDDLVYLKRGGRISATAAFVGTVLNIKPVLHVDDEGHLISMFKVRGRKQSVQALAQKYTELAEDPKNGIYFISHGDCLEDARQLESLIAAEHGVQATIITNVGPVIGSHSGPGTLALFFLGKNR